MDYKSEYEEIKEEYIDFLNEFKSTIKSYLKSNNISTAFEISGRLKAYESIRKKIDSNVVELKRSLTELHDLVGLRIVLLFPEFKDKVVEILSSNLIVIKDSQIRSQPVDKFGYSSIHLILKIKENWTSAPQWEKHKNKIIEVQIRTLSEHIWAETSHFLFYKRDENIPDILNRDLSRVAALLEIVDEKLQNIKIKLEKHFDYISTAPYSEILKLDLNAETFRRVMEKNSNKIYRLDDFQNQILSSKIEKDYNILNVNVLEELIVGKIELNGIDSKYYIDEVINLLENYKTESLRNAKPNP